MIPFIELAAQSRVMILVLFLLAATALVSLLFIKLSRTRTLRTSIVETVLLLLLLADLGALAGANFYVMYPGRYIMVIDSPAEWPVQLHLALLCLILLWLGISFIREMQIRRTTITPDSIREAFDNLPSGLSFSRENGLQVLTNYKMEKLAYILTGSTLMNARQFWEKLAVLPGEKRLESMGDQAYLLPDGSAWRFSRTEVHIEEQTYYQIIASDITRFHRFSQKLLQENAELAAYHERLKKLQNTIIATKNAEEILASKINIHERLGQCLLVTRRYLVQKQPQKELNEILVNWEEVINLLEINLQEAGKPAAHALQELTEVAAALELTIHFVGGNPEEARRFPLLKNALREAMTNAVRHAGATVLTVQMDIKGDTLYAVLSDNGSEEACTVIEGSGLSSLRSRIEQAGGRMEIRSTRGVELWLTIPGKENNP